MKKTLLGLTFTILLVLFTNEIILAQPPLPAAPSAAPIDGGLGLLAAAGGAYAWKKLRNKKESNIDL